MQYHLNGFKTGDPSVHVPGEPRPDVGEVAGLTDVDVLIVGCGPAGLVLAAQLAAFPEISVMIVEQKSGPLEMGQADGIACRSVEMFEAFGFAERVLGEAYWVNEVAFWRPDPEAGVLHCADRIEDVEPDLSEMPHVILSQARVHDFLLETMGTAPRPIEPLYGHALESLERGSAPEDSVIATLKSLEPDAPDRVITARYVVGCDGARSAVRRSMGLSLKGDAARQLWGVMDVLAVTDFPDIRLKAALQSQDQGSILVIPREGGYLVRLYIELDALEEGERAADRNVTAQMLVQKAQQIFAPFALDVKEIAWWSAYEIGQRVCDVFDDAGAGGDDGGGGGLAEPRIFIAGDACHTHSPKAGQGMNVSMADTFNLGWKLAGVLRGQMRPEILQTYSQERQAKAQELIDFDRDMARLFSERTRSAEGAAQFQRYFKKHGRYTAGVETRYDASSLVGDGAHQGLAVGLKVGMRFHSAPVVRLGDAKPMHLGHVLKADGRWRLFAFAAAGDHGQAEGEIAKLCAYLSDDPASPLRRYTRAGADVDSVVDLRAVFQVPHREMRLERLPDLLVPRKGRYGLKDYEKVFCPSAGAVAGQQAGADIFDLRGIDRERGALIVIRPDQFIARVQPLEDYRGLTAFFDDILTPV
jgi:phenol 2-monooxygenase